MRFTRNARVFLPSEPLGVVVIGCGYWGRNYVRVFNELVDARVVAVCDASLERLEAIGAAFPNVRLTTSLDEALALPGVHAAVVCTPASTHYAVARRCLSQGVHVLVEKPLTTRSSDADKLMRVADAADVTLMAGHTFIYNSGIRKVKEYVDREDFGRLYYLYARRTSLGPIRNDVDALWDLAPHDLSIFDYLLGKSPERVSATGACILHEEREDVGFITLTYPGGVVALVHVSWADPHKTREVVVVGSEKRILFNDLDPMERVRVFNKGVSPALPEAPTYGEFAFLLRDGDISSPMVEASEPLKNQCEHFVNCVRTGEAPLTDGLAGQRVVRVMEAIDESLRNNGRPVALAEGRLHADEYRRRSGLDRRRAADVHDGRVADADDGSDRRVASI